MKRNLFWQGAPHRWQKNKCFPEGYSEHSRASMMVPLAIFANKIHHRYASGF